MAGQRQQETREEQDRSHGIVFVFVFGLALNSPGSQGGSLSHWESKSWSCNSPGKAWRI
jgi:hypothetical protein